MARSSTLPVCARASAVLQSNAIVARTTLKKRGELKIRIDNGGQEVERTKPRPVPVYAGRNGGLVAYGGFLAGFVGALAYLRHKKRSLLSFADVAAPTLAMGLMLTLFNLARFEEPVLLSTNDGLTVIGMLAIRFTLNWQFTLVALAVMKAQRVQLHWLCDLCAQSVGETS